MQLIFSYNDDIFAVLMIKKSLYFQITCFLLIPILLLLFLVFLFFFPSLPWSVKYFINRHGHALCIVLIDLGFFFFFSIIPLFLAFYLYS